MKEKTLRVPEIIQIAGTRVALGAGIGLLLGNKLNEDKRKGAGLALLMVGILSTIPIALNVFGKRSPLDGSTSPEQRGTDFEKVAA